MVNMDLKKKFEEYFDTTSFERFYEELDIRNPLYYPEARAIMEEMLEAAFIQGARVMSQDTIEALRDYGTAYAGLDTPRYTSTEAFDMAAGDLLSYYNTILRNEAVPCKTHPNAPHGFLRNASHNSGRYVCECEHWEDESELAAFLSFMDGHPELVAPADEAQLDRLDQLPVNVKV